jgi:hypothetical protein
MTHDDIIRLAQEAKLPYEYDTGRVLHLKELERFAALVASAERETCAQVCEAIAEEYASDPRSPDPNYCAAAIRARGEESSNG